MAINNSILTQTWEGQPKSTIEDGLKTLLMAILAVVESPVIAESSVGRDQLTQALRDAIDSISSKVPNNRKINDMPLTADVTIGAGDIQVDGQSLAALLDDMDTRIQQAGQGEGYNDDELWEAVNSLTTTLNTLIGSDNVQGVIDTFNEVKAFLYGINMSDPAYESLAATLTRLNTLLAGKISGIKANGASTTLPVDSNGIVELPPSSSGENNVQSDWAETDTTDAAYIQNKPDLTLFATKTELNGKQDKINDIASIRTNSGKGVADMSSNEDGTVVYILANGDTYTLDLNHEHPQYQPLLTAGTNITIATNPQTGNLEISASGGNSGGITGITMNGNNVSVSGGVANLGTVIQSLSGCVQSNDITSIVKLADEAAYTALATKDSGTLYLIPES